MLDSDAYRELRNGKRNNTISERTMSKDGSIEDNRASISSKNAEDVVSEVHTLTQEEVNEQMKRLIAPLTHQREELTRLVQRMVITPHPSLYPWTDHSNFSGTVTHQPDNRS